MNAFSLTEHDPPAEADLEHAECQRLEQRRLGVRSLSPDLVVVTDESGRFHPDPGTPGPAILADYRAVASWHCLTPSPPCRWRSSQGAAVNLEGAPGPGAAHRPSPNRLQNGCGVVSKILAAPRKGSIPHRASVLLAEEGIDVLGEVGPATCHHLSGSRLARESSAFVRCRWRRRPGGRDSLRFKLTADVGLSDKGGVRVSAHRLHVGVHAPGHAVGGPIVACLGRPGQARRDLTPSLSKMCLRWVLTVWGDMKSDSPMSRSVFPSEASRATAASALVRASQPVLGRFEAITRLRTPSRLSRPRPVPRPSWRRPAP